jgi:rubrerythrin
MDRDERSRLIGVIEEIQTREQRNRATHSWNPEGGETLECLACGALSHEAEATRPCPCPDFPD